MRREQREGEGTRRGIEQSARTPSRGPLLIIGKRRATEAQNAEAPKQLPPPDRPCTFCGASGESSIAVRVKTCGMWLVPGWYVAGTWPVRTDTAEGHGAVNGHEQPVSFNGDALVRANHGEDGELRHARPGPRRVREWASAAREATFPALTFRKFEIVP